MQEHKGKSYIVHNQLSGSACNTARGLPLAPEWARSPVATAWAGEAAQCQLLPGLNLAHSGSQ
jgi:hypothetical protein